MASHYVDSAAAGGGDGSYATPWNALTSVEGHALVAGDVVLLKRGSLWRDNLLVGWSGTLDNPIVIMDYGSGDLPKITGSALVATWTQHSGDIWQATLAAEPKVVLFDGVVGSPQANHDACTAAGHWCWESGVLYVYSTSDPDTAFTAPGVEAGTSRWGIYTNYVERDYISISNIDLYGFDGSPAIHAQYPAGWTISGVTVEKSARTGFHLIAPTDLIVHGCTLTGIRTLVTGWKGIYCYGVDSTHTGGDISIYDNDVTYWTSYGVHVLGYSYLYRCHNVTVYDNDLSHNTTGAYFSYVEDGSVYGNTCADNLMGPNSTGLEQYGLAFQTASNMDIYDNEISAGRCGIEIWAWVPGVAPFPLSGPSDGNKVHHNKIWSNSEHGFLIYEGNCAQTEIYRNIIYGNHYAGIAVTENSAEAAGNVIRHNTLYNNNTGNDGYADLFFGTACPGWTFKNNCIFNVTGYAVRSPNAVLAAAHAHNLYWKTSGNLIDDHGTYYTTADGATWETDGSLWADPKFTSVTGGSENFTPQSDSPVIDAAEDLGDTTDYYGNGIV